MGTTGIPEGGVPTDRTQHIVDEGATADSALDSSEISLEIDATAEEGFEGGVPTDRTGH